MPQWFGHDNKWDHNFSNGKYVLRDNGEYTIRTPEYTGSYDSPESYLHDQYELGNLITGITVLLLISKIIRNRGIEYPDIFFVVMLILRLSVPEIGIAYCIFGTYRLLLDSPHIYKRTKGWFKNNINKRAELEAELRLMNQL